MRLTDRLNLAQRIVVFSMAPIRTRLGPPRWLRLIVWLVLDGIWTAAALVVLRSPRGIRRRPLGADWVDTFGWQPS